MPGACNAPDNEDLYCITCGYNLRGLNSDPRRCPECGAEHTVEELRLPADLVSRELWQLEACPKWSVGGMWLTAAGFIPILMGAGTGLCGGIVLVLGITIWFVGALGFAQACRCKRGWWRVLLTYYVVWSLAGGAVLAYFWAVMEVQNQSLRTTLTLIALLALLGAPIIGAVMGRKRLSLPTIPGLDLPRKRLEAFSREVAVMMVRKELAVRRRWVERAEDVRAEGIPPTGSPCDVTCEETEQAHDGQP